MIKTCVGESIRPLLKYCGESVQINEFCKICMPEVVEIDHHCRICDFVFIWGGKGVKIGYHNDIQPQVMVWGGGELVIGNYVSVGLGSILLTATYSHKEGLRMVDGLPEGHTLANYGRLVIQDDVYLGAGCNVLPNITIGEGAIIGANSLVNKDVDPWGIYVGSPAKKIGERPRLNLPKV